MAANLGQAFLGGAGITPSLAQELAAGNYNHEARETFHDYIYTKLILGEEKGPGANNANAPVFPNTNLSNSYPNSIPSAANVYNHASTNPSNNSIESIAVSSSSKTYASPTPIMAVDLQKSAALKKRPIMQQPNVPLQMSHGQGSLDSPTKVKKKSHHKKKEKTNVCDVCGRGFAEKYTLNRHMLTHTHVKPFSCSKCNMSFSRSDGLAKHMAAGHRRIDAHHCDVCGGTFNSEVSFEQHRREYGNTLPFVCNLCMLAFSQCCHLNYHMKSHSLSKMNDSFVASIQEDKNNVIDVSELIPEDFTPPKKNPNKDMISGFMYHAMGKAGEGKRNGDHPLGLMDPNIVIKPEIEEMPTCGTLNNQMPGGSGHSSGLPNPSLPYDALNNHSHMNPQGPAPSYLPDTSTGTTGVHPISDIEMKKYFDIKIPNPKFMEGGDARGVGEDGLFRCELCGKGFTRKYHMQRHVKLHTRGPIPKAHLLDWTRRPYACGVCKMGFTRQHHLTRHMLIHTGERPHSCHVCGKAFRRYTNLSLHVRTVHGAERPFKCQICGRGFPRLYSLQRHLKLHAKNAGISTEAGEQQMYKGFAPIGVVDHTEQHKQGSAFASVGTETVRTSPSHGRDSLSSEHSDESERYDHDSDAHDGSISQVENSSPLQEHRNYSQNQAGSEAFSQQTQNNGQPSSMTQIVSHHGQNASRMGQPNLMPNSHEHELINQANRSLRHDSDSMRRPTPVQNQPPNDYNPTTNLQSGNSDRYNPPISLANQIIRNMDMPAALANFTELELRREVGNFISQRGNAGEGFVLHQQRIQSPHPLLTSLERPGSRSMMSQPGAPDNFHHNQSSFSQQQATLLQQRVSMDLSAARNTMSPAVIRTDSGGYTHNHHIDMGANRAGMNEPPAYSHAHVGGLQFTTLYQPQLQDNLTHLELHPNPAASPMPVNSHNSSNNSNNIQY
ncbi:uncharacterized protein LOC131928465 [Physella acuta]|uniref:uncharacterized protein LOC131928465 n=1 Tax=Physella acuta TaxID=109671 RepID=UPI0027DDABEB|nr:uncharacterized protein LOC131928465 [Physella acuta]